MNSSVWRDVRSWNRGRSGSGDMIVGLHDGNRIWRVSPDNGILPIRFQKLHYEINAGGVPGCIWDWKG